MSKVPCTCDSETVEECCERLKMDLLAFLCACILAGFVTMGIMILLIDLGVFK